MKTKRSITSDRKIETTGLRKDITRSEREIMILLAHIINPRVNIIDENKNVIYSKLKEIKSLSF